MALRQNGQQYRFVVSNQRGVQSPLDDGKARYMIQNMFEVIYYQCEEKEMIMPTDDEAKTLLGWNEKTVQRYVAVMLEEAAREQTLQRSREAARDSRCMPREVHTIRIPSPSTYGSSHAAPLRSCQAH